MSEWRSGGYFLMGPVAEAAVKDARLPRPLWSVSACVSDSYPDETCLQWVHRSPERDEELCEVFDISMDGLEELKADVTGLFDHGVIRWPSVFASVTAAREFHDRWLTHVPGLRLLGISLRETDVPGFLADVAPVANPGDGVASLLAEGRAPTSGEHWGFEVLGSDFGTFHTYLCHGLETDLMDRLDVGFNDRGLIESWTDAARASEWINRDEVGAEPVPWYPWRIAGYGMGNRARPG